MTLAEIPKRAGLPAKTVRYYEDIGVDPAGVTRQRMAGVQSPGFSLPRYSGAHQISGVFDRGLPNAPQAL